MVEKNRRERAAIYPRQSTYREGSISLELQETAGRDYAARHGYDVVAVVSEPGLSGRTFNRPGVAAVMDIVGQGTADIILLWKWSRLSRNRRTGAPPRTVPSRPAAGSSQRPNPSTPPPASGGCLAG